MPKFLWDSCVFIAYLNQEDSSYDIPSIQQYLDDAEAGTCQIFVSSIGFAEVIRGHLVNPEDGALADFLNDLNASITVQSANANVCEIAGRLKDIKFKKGTSEGRILTTGDAIFLATAIYLEHDLEIDLDAFHTFDAGRSSKHIEGAKAVPMLGIDEWLEGVEETDLVAQLRAVNICKPIHPEPKIV